MNQVIKKVLGASGFSLLILTTGCVAVDEYYSESTYAGTLPVYWYDDMYGYDVAQPIPYYQSDYIVRGHWPKYSRPYIQREYRYYFRPTVVQYQDRYYYWY